MLFMEISIGRNVRSLCEILRFVHIRKVPLVRTGTRQQIEQ